MKLTSEFADNETDIMRKVLRGGGSLPAAFAYQPFRAGKVVECNKWFYAIFFTAGNHCFVMVHSLAVKVSFLRLDARPFNRKAVRV